MAMIDFERYCSNVDMMADNIVELREESMQLVLNY